MSNIEKLKQLAAQLAEPSAEKGLEIADMMNQTNIKMTRHAIENLHIQIAEQVLELGHANAGHLDELFEHHPTIGYTGLETSYSMYKEAQRKNQKWVESSQAQFIHYNGKDIPFAAESFNKIFSVNTIYFWTDIVYLLSCLKKILRSGGRIALTFASRNFMQSLPFTAYGFNLYETEEIEKLLMQTGFENIEIKLEKEYVVSKSGDPVERLFSTVIGQKLK